MVLHGIRIAEAGVRFPPGPPKKYPDIESGYFLIFTNEISGRMHVLDNAAADLYSILRANLSNTPHLR